MAARSAGMRKLLQQGRAPLSAEVELVAEDQRRGIGLQQGRAPLSAEVRCVRFVCKVGNVLASTGPRSFERGGHLQLATFRGYAHWLQQGRAPLSAEVCRREVRR